MLLTCWNKLDCDVPIKLDPALDCIAVVKNAGTFREIPELFIVADTPLPVKALLSPTKLLPALDCIAVVKYAPVD